MRDRKTRLHTRVFVKYMKTYIKQICFNYDNYVTCNGSWTLTINAMQTFIMEPLNYDMFHFVRSLFIRLAYSSHTIQSSCTHGADKKYVNK
jgi:hypothetical protein